MMEKKTYITDEERQNCRKIADAYTELYEEQDIVVLDAGRYGFVKLQYYKSPWGFDNVMIYTDSRRLFDDLWEEWLNTKLLALVRGTLIEEMEYEEIFRCLPEEKQMEFMKKREYFAEKAGIVL